MEFMGSVLERHPSVVIVLDEVYNYIAYEANVHLSFSKICPRLRSRIITIGSAGKTFSVTGNEHTYHHHVLVAQPRVCLCRLEDWMVHCPA